MNNKSYSYPGTHYKNDSFDNNQEGYERFSGQTNGHKYRVL
jgi:hypothetical protein